MLTHRGKPVRARLTRRLAKSGRKKSVIITRESGKGQRYFRGVFDSVHSHKQFSKFRFRGPNSRRIQGFLLGPRHCVPHNRNPEHPKS
jgi:hypothetical protein